MERGCRCTLHWRTVTAPQLLGMTVLPLEEMLRLRQTGAGGEFRCACISSFITRLRCVSGSAERRCLCWLNHRRGLSWVGSGAARAAHASSVNHWQGKLGFIRSSGGKGTISHLHFAGDVFGSVVTAIAASPTLTHSAGGEIIKLDLVAVLNQRLPAQPEQHGNQPSPTWRAAFGSGLRLRVKPRVPDFFPSLAGSGTV